MNFLVALVVALAAAVVAAGLAATVVHVLVRREREAAAADHDHALAAAVDAVALRAGQTLAEERHATIDAAVDRVVKIASSTLGDTVAAGNRELDLRSKSFEKQVADIGGALQALGGQVAELQKERAAQTGSLLTQLEEVATTQRSLAEHTQHLRQALASPKQRGQWGERMAEDVLAAAGMREGVNYHKQTAVAGGTIPDFRFLLPRDLELRMDVKFPVDNYLRVLEADTDDVRARHTKAFVGDVRNHIRSLAGRGYVDPRDTVECLLLFIPNEAVYSFLHESDPEVVDLALGHQVILCSPSTLFAVLAVVRRSVEQFQLERRSDEILRCLDGIRSEWDRFADTLDKAGRQLDTVHKTFHDEVNGTRRRVFQRAMDEVDALPEASAPGRTGPEQTGPEQTGPSQTGPEPSGEALAARLAAGDIRPLPVDGSDGVPEAG